MEVLGVAALVQAIIIVLLLIVSFIALSDVVFNHIILSKYSRPSAMIYIYVLDALLFVGFGIAYSGYLIAWWRPEENCYNARIIFWMGLAAGVVLCTRQIGVFYLGVERIMIIVWPLDTQVNQFRMNVSLCILCIVSQLLVIFIGCGIAILDTPNKISTNCRALSCLMNASRVSIYLYFRIISSAINSSISVPLYVILRRTEHLRNDVTSRGPNSGTRLSTKIAITTFFSTFIFDFLPHLTVQILYYTLSDDISQKMGPYSIFFGSLDVVLSAMFCNHSFRQQRKMTNKRKMAYVARRPQQQQSRAS